MTELNQLVLAESSREVLLSLLPKASGSDKKDITTIISFLLKDNLYRICLTLIYMHQVTYDELGLYLSIHPAAIQLALESIPDKNQFLMAQKMGDLTLALMLSATEIMQDYGADIDNDKFDHRSEYKQVKTVLSLGELDTIKAMLATSKTYSDILKALKGNDGGEFDKHRELVSQGKGAYIVNRVVSENKFDEKQLPEHYRNIISHQ